jgi:competence protein ComEA
LRSLERRELVGLLMVGVLIVAGAGFWYVRSLPSAVRVETTGPPGMTNPGDRAARPSPSPAVVVVDVAGWIRKPGVYQFHQGDRVIDAINRAGGPRRGADLTSINLAALLVDAQQVIVGKAGGEGVPSGTTTGPSGGGGGGLVSINTATLDQLETLPGIGPALGQRIIDYREQHGPFHSVDELLNVSGIGDKRLADLRSMVTV